jgi:hypothetical protein
MYNQALTDSEMTTPGSKLHALHSSWGVSGRPSWAEAEEAERADRAEAARRQDRIVLVPPLLPLFPLLPLLPVIPVIGTDPG